jgi:hypothetical protein
VLEQPILTRCLATVRGARFYCAKPKAGSYVMVGHQYADLDLKGWDRLEALYLPLFLFAIPPSNAALRSQGTKSALLYSASDTLGSLICMLQQSEI